MEKVKVSVGSEFRIYTESGSIYLAKCIGFGGEIGVPNPVFTNVPLWELKNTRTNEKYIGNMIPGGDMFPGIIDINNNLNMNHRGNLKFFCGELLQTSNITLIENCAIASKKISDDFLQQYIDAQMNLILKPHYAQHISVGNDVKDLEVGNTKIPVELLKDICFSVAQTKKKYPAMSMSSFSDKINSLLSQSKSEGKPTTDDCNFITRDNGARECFTKALFNKDGTFKKELVPAIGAVCNHIARQFGD